MMVAATFARPLKFVLALVTLAGLSAAASAQAPYLLPYTIQSIAGGGTQVAAGTACAGAGQTGTSFDAFGDGCLVTSSTVVVGGGNDIHDVAVDPQGNIYFLDNTSNGVVRRIDARTGMVTVYAGSYIVQSQCAATIDFYGDGCTANDGKANAVTGYSGNLGKARGLGMASNGDLYLSDYGTKLIHKISAATGQMTLVAGFLAGGSAAKPLQNKGTGGYTGDGGSPTSAALNAPRGVTADASGNVYIADTTNNVIRKVTAATGTISTIAGSTSGAFGPGGDGGPASSALLQAPEDVEVDANLNLFIADSGNNRVRVIYQGGVSVAKLIALTNPGTTAVAGNIYTVLGGGTGIYTPGMTVPATSIAVAGVRKIALDGRGNVYLDDNGNDVIWFLDASTGQMRIIAGTKGLTAGGAGCAQQTNAIGDNCPATQATINPVSSSGVAIDAFGQILITDTGDLRIRRVNTNQAFPTVAFGSSVTQTLQVHFAPLDGPTVAAAFTINGNADFVVTGTPACTVNADTTQDCLVQVLYTPTVPGRESANLVITSTLNGSISVGLSGAGTAAALALDPGATASLSTTLKTPLGLTQDFIGNTYVADTGSNRILRISAAGTTTVIAGNGTSGYTGDGALATAATLKAPKAVAVARNGFIYIADTGNNVLRRIDPTTGFISTIAGGASAVCSSADDALGDGCLGVAALLSAPSGLAADADGNILFSDTGNNVIRELTFGGYVFPVAGGAAGICASSFNPDSFGNNCTPFFAIFSGPTALAIDSSRNLYVADTGNNEVREIVASTNTIIRVAGNGQPGSSGNGGTANLALLTTPTGVSVDAAGNVYIADTGNAAIRVVSGGLISTIAGTLNAPGTGTLPGSAYAVQLNNPAGVASNGAGRLTILDSGNNRVFTDDRGSVSYDFGRTNLTFSSPTLSIQQSSTGSVAATLASPFTTNTGSTASFSLTPSGSNGCTAGQTLAPGTNCLLSAQFTPVALGLVTATYIESGTNTINSPAPFFKLTGTGAVLTTTSSNTVINTATPQFSVPFTATTTVVPLSCNTAAPACFPTGTVTFYVDNTVFGLPIQLDAKSTATQTINGLTVGTHPIVAVYSGDSFYASSTAPGVNAILAKGPTTTKVNASAATTPQFQDLTLTASVASTTSNIPTGTISFYAGTTLIGTAPIGPTGIAPLSDVLVLDKKGNPTHLPGSFGLPAGMYALTAVYSGDTNYAPSTSAAYSLTISADKAMVSLIPPPPQTLPILSTAQGSTGQATITVTPTNTVNGVITLACTGMPTNSVCTFSPTNLTFSSVAGVPTPQQVQVTLWTDVPPGVNPATGAFNHPLQMRGQSSQTAYASLLGWPILLASLFAVFGFRRRLRSMRLLTLVALLGILTGGSAVLTGCSGSSKTVVTTPTGVYPVTLTVSGANIAPTTLPISFTVTPGVAGQL